MHNTFFERISQRLSVYKKTAQHSLWTDHTCHMFYMITLLKLTLTCSRCGDDLGLATSSISLGGVRCYGDRVGGFRLQSTDDSLLQNGKKISRSRVKRNR